MRLGLSSYGSVIREFLPGLATEGAPESVKVSDQEAHCESDSAEQDQKRSSVEKDAAIGGEGCSEEKNEASVVGILIILISF